MLEILITRGPPGQKGWKKGETLFKEFERANGEGKRTAYRFEDPGIERKRGKGRHSKSLKMNVLSPSLGNDVPNGKGKVREKGGGWRIVLGTPSRGGKQRVKKCEIKSGGITRVVSFFIGAESISKRWPGKPWTRGRRGRPYAAPCGKPGVGKGNRSENMEAIVNIR